MAAVKWIFVVIFGLGSAGSLAMAFVESGGPRTITERKAPELSLRAFPQMTLAAGKAPEPANAAEPVAAKEPAKDDDAAKAPEPAKPPDAEPAKDAEPVAAKTPEPAAKPPEPKPEPAAKPPEPKPEPVAPKPPEPKPEPVAAKPPEPKPEPKPEAAAPPAPKPEGILNLRASDTADVFLDGKKLGGSPLLGVKAKVGNHKVRFDCYDAAGNTVAGPSQTITVKADQEVDVEFPCPSE